MSSGRGSALGMGPLPRRGWHESSIQRISMLLIQTPTLWLGDPLAAVLLWSMRGIIPWALVSALVGSFLGILCEWDWSAQRRQYEVGNRSRRVAHRFSVRALTQSAVDVYNWGRVQRPLPTLFVHDLWRNPRLHRYVVHPHRTASQIILGRFRSCERNHE